MPFPTQIGSLASRLATEFRTLRTLMTGSATGTLTGLTTTDKSSLLAAINEVKASSGGGSSVSAPPSYAGARTKPFDPMTSFYNVTPTSMLNIRKFSQNPDGVFPVPVAFWGDSIAAGAYSVLGTTDPATTLRSVLRGEGANLNGTGMVYAYNSLTNPTSGRDARWTTFTGWTNSAQVNWPWAYTTTAGAVAVFQSDVAGTQVEVPYYNTYQPMAVYIDGAFAGNTGGTGTGATPTSIGITSFTGLLNIPHKVEIRSIASGSSALIGVRVRSTVTGNLEVSNQAMGGSTTANWLPSGASGENYQTASATCGGLSGMLNGVVFLSLGGNDVLQNGIGTLATIKANLGTIIAALQAQSATVVIMASQPCKSYEEGGSYSNVTAAAMNALRSAQYDLADQYDCPLFDQYHYLVSYATLNARSMMSDEVHPSIYAMTPLVRQMAQVIFKGQSYESKPDPLLTEYTDTQPSSPATGLKIYSKIRGGRRFLSQVGPSGYDVALQPNFFSNKIARITAIAGGTTPSLDGMSATHLNNATATPAAVSPTVNGTVFTAAHRYRCSTTTTAGTGAGTRGAAAWSPGIGNPGAGGWFAVFRFGLPSIVTGARAFVGMYANSAVISPTVEPSTLNNILGIGLDSGDTNWQMIVRAASGSATKIDTGIPRTATSVLLEVALFCPANAGATCQWSVRRLDTGAYVTGAALTGWQATTLYAPHFHVSNNAQAAAQAIDIQSLYIETDN